MSFYGVASKKRRKALTPSDNVDIGRQLNMMRMDEFSLLHTTCYYIPRLYGCWARALRLTSQYPE
jgi:hypothetical protein